MKEVIYTGSNYTLTDALSCIQGIAILQWRTIQMKRNIYLSCSNLTLTDALLTNLSCIQGTVTHSSEVFNKKPLKWRDDTYGIDTWLLCMQCKINSS